MELPEWFPDQMLRKPVKLAKTGFPYSTHFLIDAALSDFEAEMRDGLEARARHRIGSLQVVKFTKEFT